MRKLFLFATMVALLNFSCGNNNEETKDLGGGEKASLTIKLAGSSKAEARAIGPVTQAEENAIHGYIVYVFYNDVLEKRTELIPVDQLNPDYTYTLNGLTTGTKKIVVIANPVNTPLLSVGDSYSRFSEAGFNTNLDDQATLTNGLIMTGEATTTLAAAPAANAVTVPVTRIVAKIKLGTITVTPAVGTQASLLTITGLAIMDAPSISSLGLPSIITTPPLYGGLLGGINVTPENFRTHLFEPITWTVGTQDYEDRFFYVFADQLNEPNYPTYMTLQGTYNGNPSYFVFAINHILRNTEHTVNITLRRLGSGSPGPDIPSDPTTLEVTIVPQDWAVQLPQNVEW